MPATYEPIATTTLGSAASTITFSSIPATYTDLRLVLTTTTSSADTVYLQFNGVSTTTYSGTYLYGDGATASSARRTSVTGMYAGFGITTSTTIPSMWTWDVFSYAGSTNKTTLNTVSNDFNGSGAVTRSVALWRSTAAITSVSAIVGANFNTGTTATLYGIKKA